MELVSSKWTFLALAILFMMQTATSAKTLKKDDADLNKVSQGTDEKADKLAEKLKEEEDSKTGSFRLTREEVVPVEGGVMMDLEYEATTPMKVYWKKVINGVNNPYWIPVQGEEDRAKTEQIENQLGEGFTGSSSIQIQHDNPAEMKLIATFYNKNGNLLYEYSPDLSKLYPSPEDKDQTATTPESDDTKDKKVPDEDNKQETQDSDIAKTGLFTERAIDVLMHPPAVTKVGKGQEVKIMCAFLVPKIFNPVIEWIRVRYQGMGKDHIFFTKNVTVLSTEKDSVTGAVAGVKNTAVSTKKQELAVGTVVTSELVIKAIDEDHEGIYTCHLTEDTPTPYTFISAFTEILPLNRDSPYPKSKVYIKFFTCDAMFKPVPEKTIKVKLGVPNCFSCGGYGYPQPSVGLFKDGEQLADSSTSEMSLGRDVSAVTYVLNNPTKDDQGVYACVATNGHGDAYWIFNVIVE